MSFSLGLGGGGGSYIRFSPSVNGWLFGGEEITPKKMIFDIDSTKTGWCRIEAGSPPEWVWDEAVGRRGAKPGDDFKRGFSVMVWLGPDRGWAEWSSNGSGPGMGFEPLYVEAMQQKEDGKALAVQYTGSTPMKVGKGNTRVPNFELLGWVDKPADDGDEAEEAPSQPVGMNIKRSSPPSTGSKAVGAPPKKSAPIDLGDFG